MKKITQRLLSCCALFSVFSIPVMAQNVGIGVATPGNKLHVEANTAADGIRIDNVAANGDPILQYRVNGTARITMGIDDSDADKFKIGTTAITTGTVMTIQTNGYIGLTTTAPTHALHMVRNFAGNYMANFENTNATGASLGAITAGPFNSLGGVTNNVAGVGVYGVHIPATGAGWSVWGTSNSSDAIGVRGTIPTAGSWLGFGGLFVGGLGYANGLYNLSDARMKSEVRQIDGALDKLMQLEGVKYKYNSAMYKELAGDDDRTYMGLIAQDVEKIFPEATAQKYMHERIAGKAGTTADRSKLKKETVTVVDYTALIPVLIEAVKEQQVEIERLNAQIEELRH